VSTLRSIRPSAGKPTISSANETSRAKVPGKS
jgi:hypothetical protein